jgi:hypothetical protein
MLSILVSLLANDPRPFPANGAVLYDAADEHPQCTQTTEPYLRDCVMLSDGFAYFLATEPVITTEKTCAELGYMYVFRDPVFDFDLCEWRAQPPQRVARTHSLCACAASDWKGGRPAFFRWFGVWGAKHPLMMKMLNVSKNANPACKERARCRHHMGRHAFG